MKIKISVFCIVITSFFLFPLCTPCIAQDTAEMGKQRVADSLRKDSIAKAINLRPDKKNDVTRAKTDTTSSNKPIKSSEPLVLRAYSFNTKDSSAGIGDMIVLEVLNLDSLMRRAKALNQNISLYVDGRKIDNIKPLSGAPDKDKGTLQYRLDRNTENDKIWADILGAPPVLHSGFFLKPVKISAGLENEFAIRTNSEDTNFSLIRIREGWFWACSGIIIIYLLVVISMVRNQGLLRDRSIDISSLGILNNTLSNPYSLGRFQMAFWFTLTLMSFFFIWLITDAYNIITPTVLALIGISAGTSISAAVIDNSKNTELLNRTIELQSELARLNIEIPKLTNSTNALPAPLNITDLQSQLAIKTARLADIPPSINRNITILTPKTSEGFFKDILTDVNGVGFHRLQMFMWTLVLGLIFLYSVWKRLSMPEFDATLLALQGLTSVTYLGFKFPEKHV